MMLISHLPRYCEITVKIFLDMSTLIIVLSPFLPRYNALENKSYNGMQIPDACSDT